MSPEIEIRFYDTKRFGELKEMWEALEHGKDMTVFQRYIWYYGLNEQYLKGCYGIGEKAVYAVAFKNGKAAMIAPLHIKKFGWEYKGIGSARGIYIIGEWGFTDYLNFIYDEFDTECADAIIAGVTAKFRMKSLYFHFIKKGNSFDAFLTEKYGKSKTGETICVQVPPHSSFEEFHKTMTKYSRQNIRKAFNRENNTQMEIHIEEFNNISQSEAEEFFSIYLARSVSKNELNLKEDGLKKTVIKYFNKRYNDNLKSGLSKSNYIVFNMVNNPDSYMIGIFNNDKKIGFIYGIMEGSHVWRNIIVCFDEEYKYYTPGRTAYFRYFRDILYANGGGTEMITDMSRGTERHKYELGGTEHYLVNYNIRLHRNNSEDSNVKN